MFVDSFEVTLFDVKILKLISKNPNISLDDITKYLKCDCTVRLHCLYLHKFVSKKVIGNDSYGEAITSDNYTLTDKAIVLHEADAKEQLTIRRSWVQWLVPTIISIIALIGAYRQEASWLIREITLLMK